MSFYQSCPESWELTLWSWKGTGVNVLEGKAWGPPSLSRSCAEQGSSSLNFTWRSTDGVCPRIKHFVPKQTFVTEVLRRSRTYRSQNNLLVSVSTAGADSYFVGGLTVAGNGWGAVIAPLPPHAMEREGGEARRAEAGCGSQTCSSHSNRLVSLFTLTPRIWVHSWEN